MGKSRKQISKQSVPRTAAGKVLSKPGKPVKGSAASASTQRAPKASPTSERVIKEGAIRYHGALERLAKR